MLRALEWLRKEVRELLFVFLFFLAAFMLLVATEALATNRHGIGSYQVVGAVVMALVVAKVVIIANHLPFVDRFRQRPLVYNTAWKSCIYVFAVILFRYVERLIPYIERYGSLAAANRHLMARISWSHFWALQIWLTVLIFAFVALQELTHALGENTLRRMFFGR